MKKRLFVLSLSTLLLSSCGSPARDIIDMDIYALNNVNKPLNTYVSNIDGRYLNALQQFSEDFYQLIDQKQNQVFSPISISTCYSMTYEGSNTETKTQLASLLHYDESLNYAPLVKDALLAASYEYQTDGKVDNKLDVSQAYFIDNSFTDYINEDYLSLLTDYYFADAFKGTLNSDEMHELLAEYINQKTNNFLKVNKEDFKDYGGVLWLLNTIYVKGQWMYQFSDAADIKDNFYDADNNPTRTTFMRSSFYNYVLESDDYLITTLPLMKGLNFTVLLPKKNDVSILNDKNAINNLLNYRNIKMSLYNIELKMPLFKIQSEYDLKDVFESIGITLPFSAVGADFSKMLNQKATDDGVKLFIGKSKHVAGLEVNHDGLEAAAYTINAYEATSAPFEGDTIKFNMDHPFAFVLTDYHNLPLFMGRVTNLND